MENQVTIWEWIEMLKEEREGELCRIISLENASRTKEVVNFKSEECLILNGFTIFVDCIEIEIVERSWTDLEVVRVALFNRGNVVSICSLYPSECIILKRYTDNAVEIVKGVI